MLLVRGIGRQWGNLDPYCIMRLSKITVSQEEEDRAQTQALRNSRTQYFNTYWYKVWWLSPLTQLQLFSMWLRVFAFVCICIIKLCVVECYAVKLLISVSPLIQQARLIMMSALAIFYKLWKFTARFNPLLNTFLCTQPVFYRKCSELNAHCKCEEIK